VAACGVGITFGRDKTARQDGFLVKVLTQFTCFTGTKVQIMTLLLLLQALSAGGPAETSRLVFVGDILVTVDGEGALVSSVLGAMGALV
jgi:hypothetical protein